MKRARKRRLRFRTRPLYRLADLLAEMPEGFPIDAEMRAWLDAPPVGRELSVDPVREMLRFMRRSRPRRSIDLKKLIGEGRD